MKTKTSVSVDDELIEKAKAKGVNMSHTLNKALHQKVHGEITDDIKYCSKCGLSGSNLVWLCPDEVWRCNNCLKPDIRQVSISISS